MDMDLGSDSSNIGNQILEWTMDMQRTWDEFRTPLAMQDKMIKMLFSGVQPSKGRKTTGDKTKSLASLLLSNGVKEVEQNIPQNLDQLFSHYKSLGFVEPQRWRLCVGSSERSHEPTVFQPSKEENSAGDVLMCSCSSERESLKLKQDCSICCMRCIKCGNTRKQMIPFDYIPFMEQLKVLCRSSINCHEFLSMWRGRDTWLGRGRFDEPNTVKEFWHGEKMRLCQDFWNPNADWEMPVMCNNEQCKKVYRTFPPSMRSEELSKGWIEETKEYHFRCSRCLYWIHSKRQMEKGDPRNFAVVCHWDGFQAASTKQKDVGVVEMSLANANKGSEVVPFPLLFIPFSMLQLEHKHGDVLQHFLTPLMEELFSSFVNGFVVDYCYPSALIADGLSNRDGSGCTLRAMLMFWTGDHPAQCQLGRFKDGGINGCRRDCPSTKKVDDGRRIPYYVFDKNRYQTRYCPKKRKAEDMYQALRESKRATTKKAKDETLAKAGLTGESCLWRLYELYGFDVSKDVVYDVMHILALNIFKKYTKALFEGSSNQLKKLLDASTREATLAAPKSLRHKGRWPSVTPSRHHNMFTAEEHQKFVMWCLPHILNKVTAISQEMVCIGMLLVDISHIFYNHTRTHGWSKEAVEVTRSLLSCWRILTEETEGANSSPLEHVAGNSEVLDDIKRHGGHDCIWCYKYERCVCKYVAIPTNNKSNEVTYARYQSRVLLTKTKENMKLEEDGLLPGERLLSTLHACLKKPEGMQFDKAFNASCEGWHKHGILLVASEKAAKHIFEVCELVDSCPCKELVESKGVLVGAERRKRRVFSDSQREYLQSFWGAEQLVDELVFFSKIFLKGERISIQDFVIVWYNEGRTLCEIEEFFFHEHAGRIEVFFVGSFANNGVSMNDLPTNMVTGMKIISKLELENKSKKILPIVAIMHKCFLLPGGSMNTHVIYEMEDIGVRKRLLQPKLPGCIPPWLEIGDVVLIEALDNPSSFGHAVVRAVCYDSSRVRLGILRQLTTNEWVVAIEENTWTDWKVCLKLLSGWIAITFDSLHEESMHHERGIRFRDTNA